MLKRRGFNVDRILNARRLERESEEQRERDRQLAAELDKANAPSPERLNDYQQQLGTMFPDADPSHVDKLLRSHKDDHLQRAAAELSDGGYPRKPRPQLPGAMPEASGEGGGEDEKRQSSLFSSFKKRFATRPPSTLPGIGPAESSNAVRQPMSAPVARPPAQPTMPDPQSQVSPTNDIKSNVLRAIAASRPDNDAAVKSLPTMREVREPQSSYCDATHATDLVYVCDVAGLRTYFARDVTDAECALEQHGAALRRFATSIIRPLADVFGMNPRSLHVRVLASPTWRLTRRSSSTTWPGRSSRSIGRAPSTATFAISSAGTTATSKLATSTVRRSLCRRADAAQTRSSRGTCRSHTNWRTVRLTSRK